MTTLAHQTRKRLGNLVVALILLSVLAAGLFTYAHYGFTLDEPTERRTSTVNYQYIVKTVTGHDLRVYDVDLEDLRDQYYGVFLQLPMVLIEHLNHFEMTSRQVYLMRHLCNFLICYIGYLCFFFFCKKLFGSKWLGLLGMLILALYPRFWGEQFTNIKDMVFMATVCASLWATQLCLEHEARFRYGVLAAVIYAVCMNTRIVGAMFPLVLLGYRLVRDAAVAPVAQCRGQKELWQRVARYLSQTLLCYAAYVLMMPALWRDPIGGTAAVFTTFSNFGRWPGKELFCGTLTPQVPWYYLPVWLGISLPLWYLAAILLFPAAFGAEARRTLRRHPRTSLFALLLTKEKYVVLCFTLAAVPWLAAVIQHSTLYNGWRHFYFILPMLCVLMVYSVRFCLRRLSGRRLMAGALCLLLANQCGFILRYHPFEKVYFNPLGVQVADGFSRDYWLEATCRQVSYILEHDPAETIRIPYYGGYGEMLTPEQQARIQVTEQADQPDYIIDAYEYWTAAKDVHYDGYTPWHTIEVSGHPISTVFIRNDLLDRVNQR